MSVSDIWRPVWSGDALYHEYQQIASQVDLSMFPLHTFQDKCVYIARLAPQHTLTKWLFKHCTSPPLCLVNGKWWCAEGQTVGCHANGPVCLLISVIPPTVLSPSALLLSYHHKDQDGFLVVTNCIYPLSLQLVWFATRFRHSYSVHQSTLQLKLSSNQALIMSVLESHKTTCRCVCSPATWLISTVIKSSDVIINDAYYHMLNIKYVSMCVLLINTVSWQYEMHGRI